MDTVVMKNIVEGNARFTEFAPIAGADTAGVLAWVVESLLRDGTAVVRDDAAAWVEPDNADFVVAQLACAGVQVFTQDELEEGGATGRIQTP